MGPDRNLWFTQAGSGDIGRITPSGRISEFPIPTHVSGTGAITAGPDGNVWFAEALADKIGRYNPERDNQRVPDPDSEYDPDSE